MKKAQQQQTASHVEREEEGWKSPPRYQPQWFLKGSAALQLYAACGWLAASLCATVLTWFLHAHNQKGGVKAATDRYDVTLPRISMTGATLPAYAVFAAGAMVHPLWSCLGK